MMSVPSKVAKHLILLSFIIQTVFFKDVGLVSHHKIHQGAKQNICEDAKLPTHHQSEFEYSDDLKSILATVKSIDFSNFASSFLSLTDPTAFPILTGKRPTPSNLYGPILAGSKYGHGHVVVGGHTHFLQLVPTDLTSDHNKLLINSIRWLASSSFQILNHYNKSKPKIALYQISSNFVLDTLFHVTEIQTEDLVAFSKFSQSDDTVAGSNDGGIGTPILTRFQVLCIGNTRPIFKNPEISQAILRFVDSGGGLFVVNTAWAWDNPQDLRLANQLIAPVGIVWEVSDKYAEPTIKNSNSFNTSEHLLVNTHAEKLWTQILAFLSSPKRVNQHQLQSCHLLDAMTSTVEKSIQSLPPNDDLLKNKFIQSILQLSLFTNDDDDIIPSKLAPVEDPLRKLILNVHHLLLSGTIQSAEKIEANPASKLFPGQLLPPLPTSTSVLQKNTEKYLESEEEDHVIQVQINSPFSSNWCDKGGRVKQNFWLSTGLYAPAGQMVYLNFTLLPSKNLQRHRFIIQIGSHTDDLSAKSHWHRFPRVTIQSNVVVVIVNKVTELKLASQFGGLIYVIVLKNSPCSQLSESNEQLVIATRGPIRAPYFVLGETSVDDWIKEINRLRAPWAEFQSGKLILTVPTMEARKVDDPEKLMETWDRIMTGFEEISSTNGGGRRVERIVADVQISGGWLHAGYPIMMHLESAIAAVNVSQLKSPASWGHLHELGHNKVRDIYQWAGTEEVINNFFVIYVYEVILDVPRETFKKKTDKEFQKKLVRQYLKNGKKFADWQTNHELALTMFLQLQENFGWDAFRQVLQKYGQLFDNTPTRLRDHDKRHLWVFMLSSVVEKNLAHGISLPHGAFRWRGGYLKFWSTLSRLPVFLSIIY